MRQQAIFNSAKIEIIAFDICTCLQIQAAGADRVELCADAGSGGTTPSQGTLKIALETLEIPVFPMIRPRGGDFLYTPEEFQVMLADIAYSKTLGCPGVVLGILDRQGAVDVSRLKQLVEAAYPMQVTFHRAFDHCRNPYQALEAIIQAGCSRILTSGQMPKAIMGTALLKELISQAGDRIVIMPGSGIRPENIALIARQTGAGEFHASLRTFQDSAMAYVNPYFPEEEMRQSSVNPGEIRALRAALEAR